MALSASPTSHLASRMASPAELIPELHPLLILLGEILIFQLYIVRRGIPEES